MLPVVLYGCETWSLILRERYRLRAFENRVLRKKFEPKTDEVTDKWSRLHNEKLHDLYPSPNIIRVINSVTLGGAGDLAVRRRGEIFVGKHEGKRAFGRCRHRREDKIKMGLEKWDGGMCWIYLARDRDKWWAM
jgi:hypothetical protein